MITLAHVRVDVECSTTLANGEPGLIYRATFPNLNDFSKDFKGRGTSIANALHMLAFEVAAHGLEALRKPR